MEMSENSVLIATSYLPPIIYFIKIADAEQLFIEAFENYTKQSLRNRAFIAGANGVLCLTVPVLKKITPLQFTKDMCIDYSTHWQRQHWRAIVSAYNSSPFFEYYKDVFCPFYEKKTKYLIDLNTEILSTTYKILNIKSKEMCYTKFFLNPSDDKNDLRYLCNSKTYNKFAGTSVYESMTPYYQVFSDKHGFVPNLSIIDLLFNEGPAAVSYLLGNNIRT